MFTDASVLFVEDVIMITAVVNIDMNTVMSAHGDEQFDQGGALVVATAAYEPRDHHDTVQMPALDTVTEPLTVSVTLTVTVIEPCVAVLDTLPVR